MTGLYSLYLTSKNDIGFPFSFTLVGKYNLTATVKGINIEPESCYLNVIDEKSSPRYTLLQGVDISEEETLKLTCTAVNTDTKTIEATPFFETHYRSIYGEIVPQTQVVNNPITFKPEEKKNISILLPKALSPQAYDVVTVLKYGENTSNAINTHYVLQGVSATIQNLSFDKDFYNKGDTATVSISFSPSADSFEGSRIGEESLLSEMILSGEFKNGKGRQCADSIEQKVLSSSVEIPFSINSSCIDPQFYVSLKDSNGNILAEKEFKMETTSLEKTDTSNTLILLIVLVLLILSIIIIMKMKNKNTPNGGSGDTLATPTPNTPIGMLFFLAFMIVSFFGINNMANASGATVKIDYDVGGFISVTIGTDKDIYVINEGIDATSTVTVSTCTNLVNGVTVYARVQGIGAEYETVYLGTDFEYGELSGSNGYIAPATPGDYNLEFLIQAQEGGVTHTATAIVPFKVVAPATVDVKVDTVDGPITKSTGSSVNVSWTSTNASSCSCSYVRAGDTISCGTRLYVSDQRPEVIPNLLEPTTFTVTCENIDGGGGGGGGGDVYYQLSPCNSANPAAEYRDSAGSWQTGTLVEGATDVYYTIAGSNTTDDPSKFNVAGITMETDTSLCK